MFNNRMLIAISGMSSRTYYRRLQELKNQRIIVEEKNYYMEVDKALQIAEAMGFKLLLEKHINKITKA
jgi:hypothetical protein